MGNCTHPEEDCYLVEFLDQWLEVYFFPTVIILTSV